MKLLLLIALWTTGPLYATATLCHDVASAAAITYESSWDGINLPVGALQTWLNEHRYEYPITAFLANIGAINGVLSGAAIVPAGFHPNQSPHPTVQNAWILPIPGQDTFEMRMKVRKAWETYFQQGNPPLDFEKLWTWVGPDVQPINVARGFNWAFFEEDPYSHIEPVVYSQGKLGAHQSSENPHMAHHSLIESDGFRIGYLSIRTFSGRAVPRYVASSLDDIRKKGAQGIILDLRDNGGGLLDEVNQIAGYFLGKKKVLLHEEDIKTRQPRLGSPKLTYTAQRVDLPTVVLVNGGSASAAEVLAGCLQHYGNAYVLGEPTYGKGTVLSPKEVMNEPGPFQNLPLIWTQTSSVYYLPSLRSPQIYGVPIDFVVGAGGKFNRERDNPTAIPNAQGPILLREDPRREKLKEVLDDRLAVLIDDVRPVDGQLFYAQELMKAWLTP